MKKVFVTGHRNPDIDSVCAAYAYAELKNETDENNEYIPIRCGHLSASVRKQLEMIGIEIPAYVRDVYPKVGNVMLKPVDKLDVDAPIYDLIQTYTTKKPSVIPLYDEGKFNGLLSVDDITAWFLKDNSEINPVYEFTVANISKILPGEVLYNAGGESFSGTLLAGAAAFENFGDFIKKNANSVVVMGLRREHIEHAMEKQVPAIILTTLTERPDIDFSDYKGLVYMTSLGTAEALRRIRMAQPLKTIMSKQEEPIQASTLFEDAKDLLTSSHARGFAVYDGDEFAGYITRRCFLKNPSQSVILVDHNEKDQSIKGIETATIQEIIDHHRLDALKTELPIYIEAQPVGSTCTIVYEQFVKNDIVPNMLTAKAILSGILADTLILRSPTTTEKDEKAAEALGRLCGIYDIRKYGEELLSNTESLAAIDPKEAINSDFKTYVTNGVRVGIGQCEVTTLQDLDKYKDRYLEALSEIGTANGLEWTVLMITDILREHSVLLTTDYKAVRKLPYLQTEKQILDMPRVMSRKKQLLPAIIHSTES